MVVKQFKLLTVTSLKERSCCSLAHFEEPELPQRHIMKVNSL